MRNDKEAAYIGFCDGAMRTNTSWRTQERTNILMVVPSVNQCICKPPVICEKLGLRLNVVRLRDSRRELTIVLPPLTGSFTEPNSEVVSTGVDDSSQAICDLLGRGTECNCQRGSNG